MEPERPIEKLLRAFAKKRRGQAGGQLELPPAARQQLHREIARRAAKKGGGFFSNFLPGLRPRLAFALCFIAVACVGGWLLLPVLINRKPKTLSALSGANRSPAGPPQKEEPAPMPVAAPPPAAPPTLAGSDDKSVLQSDRRAGSANTAFKPAPPPVQTADNRKLANVSAGETSKQANALENENGIAPATAPAGTVVASTPPSSRQMTASKTDGVVFDSAASTETLNKDARERALQPSAPPASSTIAAATPAPAEEDALKKLNTEKQPAPAAAASTFSGYAKTEAVAAAPLVSQHFYRLDALAVRQRVAGASGLPVAVLASFRVEQKGNEIRVVDADGSVYTGVVQVARDEASAALSAPPKNGLGAAQSAQDRLQQPAVQNYFFRVTGTNRNLNQKVVFSGNLIPLTNGVTSRRDAGAPGGGGFGGATRESSAPSLLSNSRISGKLTIGNQKEIEVNATPAP